MSGEYNHIVECHNVPIGLRGSDRLVDWVLQRAGRACAGLRVLWHAPDIALLVFPNATIASGALPSLQQKEMHFCILRDGFRKEYEKTSPMRLPGPTRKDTNTDVASRLIRGAIGSSLRRERAGAPSGAPLPGAHGQAAYLRPADRSRASGSSPADGSDDWRGGSSSGSRQPPGSGSYMSRDESDRSHGSTGDVSARHAPAPAARTVHVPASVAVAPDLWPALGGGVGGLPHKAGAASSSASRGPPVDSSSAPRPAAGLPMSAAAAVEALSLQAEEWSLQAAEWAPGGEGEGGGAPADVYDDAQLYGDRPPPGVWRTSTDTAAAPAMSYAPAAAGASAAPGRGGGGGGGAGGGRTGPGAPYVAPPSQGGGGRGGRQQQQRGPGKAAAAAAYYGDAAAAAGTPKPVGTPTPPLPRPAPSPEATALTGGMSRLALRALKGALSRGGGAVDPPHATTTSVAATATAAASSSSGGVPSADDVRAPLAASLPDGSRLGAAKGGRGAAAPLKKGTPTQKQGSKQQAAPQARPHLPGAPFIATAAAAAVVVEEVDSELVVAVTPPAAAEAESPVVGLVASLLPEPTASESEEEELVLPVAYAPTAAPVSLPEDAEPPPAPAAALASPSVTLPVDPLVTVAVAPVAPPVAAPAPSNASQGVAASTRTHAAFASTAGSHPHQPQQTGSKVDLSVPVSLSMAAAWFQ